MQASCADGIVPTGGNNWNMATELTGPNVRPSYTKLPEQIILNSRTSEHGAIIETTGTIETIGSEAQAGSSDICDFFGACVAGLAYEGNFKRVVRERPLQHRGLFPRTVQPGRQLFFCSQDDWRRLRVDRRDDAVGLCRQKRGNGRLMDYLFAPFKCMDSRCESFAARVVQQRS